MTCKDCSWCEEAVAMGETGVMDVGAAKDIQVNFLADLDELLATAFYCAAQGAQDPSKVGMLQAVRRKFVENYGYLP